MKYSKEITIVQPFIAHYREDFFLTLSKIHPLDLVCVRRPNVKDAFNERNNLNIKWLKSINIGSLNLFNPFSSLLNKNKIIVIMWAPRWIGLYLMLLFKIVTKRKIIIWTHGISIKKGFNSFNIYKRVYGTSYSNYALLYYDFINFKFYFYY